MGHFWDVSSESYAKEMAFDKGQNTISHGRRNKGVESAHCGLFPYICFSQRVAKLVHNGHSLQERTETTTNVTEFEKSAPICQTLFPVITWLYPCPNLTIVSNVELKVSSIWKECSWHLWIIAQSRGNENLLFTSRHISWMSHKITSV